MSRKPYAQLETHFITNGVIPCKVSPTFYTKPTTTADQDSVTCKTCIAWMLRKGCGPKVRTVSAIRPAGRADGANSA